MKVCLDWDDTLVDTASQEWLPDAEWALGRMVKAGWSVTVLSCRASWPEGRASIEAKLDGSRLSVVDVTDVKPPADVYVDDRALRFEGDWSSIFSDIKAL